MIKLGQEVKDLVTGYKGIATAKAIYLSGSAHVTIQAPMQKDGTVPDSLQVDEPQVVVLKEKPILDVKFGEPVFEMKQQVKDPLTGFTGHVTGRAWFLNGCMRVHVMPAVTKENKHTPAWYAETEIVSVGKLLKPATPKEEKANRRTGGPQPKIPRLS